MENLIDLETAFEERIESEKARLAEEKNIRSKIRSERLEKLAEAFYTDLGNRMEAFFDQDSAREEASRRTV